MVYIVMGAIVALFLIGMLGSLGLFSKTEVQPKTRSNLLDVLDEFKRENEKPEPYISLINPHVISFADGRSVLVSDWEHLPGNNFRIRLEYMDVDWYATTRYGSRLEYTVEDIYWTQAFSNPVVVFDRTFCFDGITGYEVEPLRIRESELY